MNVRLAGTRARRAPLVATAALAAALLAAPPARADGLGGLALDQLQPTPAGDAFFGVPSPFIGGHLVPRALAVFDYGHRPLQLAVGDTRTPIVSTQAFLHLNASLALWDRLLVSAVFPLAVAQDGDSPTARDLSFKSPTSVTAGDLRIGVRVRLYGEDYDPFQIALSADLYVPTAPADSFAGEGSVRDAPQLSVGGRFKHIVYSAAIGAMIRASDIPSSLTYGGGAAVTLWDDRIHIGPEVYASTLLRAGDLLIKNGDKTTTIPRETGTNAELLLGVKVRPWKGITIGAAGGPGLTKAAGTPAFRAVALLGWSPAPERPENVAGDADQDGVLDAEDACPHAFGAKSADAKKNGCPMLDRDEDGIEDKDDACPDQKGVANADAKMNGCPADRDGDGVPDAVDACPDQKGDKDRDGCPAAGDADGDGIPDTLDACPKEKGIASGDARQNGCPAGPAVAARDTDGDGVLDAEDACPREKGPRSADTKASGCPRLVRVVGDAEIVTLEPIQFKVAKKDPPPIDAKSEPALAELKDVLAQHPEYVKVEVQGHTDNTGNAGFNEKVSLARAEAVKKWLTDHGVAASRLVAKGYGGSKPVADNKSADGRAKNRRITLVVLEKK